jgi:hypothetical protein
MFGIVLTLALLIPSPKMAIELTALSISATSRSGVAHELPLALPVQPQNDKQIDSTLIRSFKSAFEAITSSVQSGFDPAHNQGLVHF